MKASVVIPNFNNGRASSRDGRHDFLGALLSNLRETLAEDPTELEIVVADDGSTDDSLETARRWSRERWPAGSPRAGQPFLRLIELQHCGVLSKVLNALHAGSTGEFVCRLDGDILIDTRDWVARCVAILERDPRMGVVTGLQKLPDGRVHAFGDAIVSPLGYHHLGQGADEANLPQELEVEHAMGCFHASRRRAIAEVGGYDEAVLRGQTEELAVRLNLAGWKALATKAVVFRHFHAERHWRPNLADTGEGLDRSLRRFEEKWGFSRLAPDLDEVWRRYADTPLVSRARLAPPSRWSPEASGDLPAGEEWSRFATDERLQGSIAQELAVMRPVPGRTAILGARSGLVAMLRARESGPVDAVEEHEQSVTIGRAFFEKCAPPLHPISFSCVSSLGSSGLPPSSYSLVASLDSVERSWNPVGTLRESMRLLAPDGVLVVRTRARVEALERRGEALHPFAAHELLQIVRHVGGLEPLAAPSSDGYGRLVLVARRGGSSAHGVHFGRSSVG